MKDRIRRALSGTAADDPLPPTLPQEPGPSNLLERFITEVEAVGAVVHRGPAQQILAEIFGAEVVEAAVGADRPLDRGVSEPPLAITRPHYLIADSGTAVEIYREGSERNASVLAAAHVMLASEATLVPDLASFYGLYQPEPNQPELAVFVTGPSRTADIEQTLVLGAHGPRELHIIFDEA